jgi:hypothetical protein
LKFEGDERHDIEILDVVSFLARQVEARKAKNTIEADARERISA